MGETLSHYHLAHSARADLCRRLGRIPEAFASYEMALALASQEPAPLFSPGGLWNFNKKDCLGCRFCPGATTIE